MMLITGCARSGTGAICKYLAEEGLDIGHELRLGRDGIASWFLAYPKTPPLGHADCPSKWDRVVHLVREPVACIASLASLSDVAMGWAGYTHDLRGHMLYWLQWNDWADYAAGERWRIEDRDDHGLGKSINSRGHGSLSWEHLYAEDEPLALRIKALAEDYGYETS